MEVARRILVGDWSEAFKRPPLPVVLTAPFLLLDENPQEVVNVVYLLASLFQFAAYALLIRLAFATQPRWQVFGLLLFLLLPINHSIHHYRNIPTVLGSSAGFLLAAHWLWIAASNRSQVWTVRSVLWVLGALALGAGSRTESLVFAALLLAFAVAMPRYRATGVHLLYGVGLLAAVAVLAAAPRLAGADAARVEYYRVSTFLNSTPVPWLTPECRAVHTEDCAERDGAAYFGPPSQRGGLVGMVLAHPGLVLQKTALGAGDNLQAVFGLNLSTYPPLFWVVWLAGLAYAPCRAALRTVPGALWASAAAALATSALPPLTWAPAYPQYHLHTVLPVAVVTIPILGALARSWRGSTLVALFWLANAAFSLLRYTRYTGY
ncbi:MAG: hypothetical protein HY690_16030 [Chloroflexi bacterium]|nr:hypothetical protein [Chloroflexota bacterium]